MELIKGVPMSIHDVRLDALFNLGNYLISSFSCSIPFILILRSTVNANYATGSTDVEDKLA